MRWRQTDSHLTSTCMMHLPVLTFRYMHVHSCTYIQRHTKIFKKLQGCVENPHIFINMNVSILHFLSDFICVCVVLFVFVWCGRVLMLWPLVGGQKTNLQNQFYFGEASRGQAGTVSQASVPWVCWDEAWLGSPDWPQILPQPLQWTVVMPGFTRF